MRESEMSSSYVCLHALHLLQGQVQGVQGTNISALQLASHAFTVEGQLCGSLHAIYALFRQNLRFEESI